MFATHVPGTHPVNINALDIKTIPNFEWQSVTTCRRNESDNAYRMLKCVVCLYLANIPRIQLEGFYGVVDISTIAGRGGSATDFVYRTTYYYRSSMDLALDNIHTLQCECKLWRRYTSLYYCQSAVVKAAQNYTSWCFKKPIYTFIFKIPWT